MFVGGIGNVFLAIMPELHKSNRKAGSQKAFKVFLVPGNISVFVET